MSKAKHSPVMLEEVLMALAVKADGIYVDGTFGRGGHSQAILQRLGSQGRLFCFDKDPQAITYGKALFAGDERVTFIHRSFADLASVAAELDIAQKIDGILLDFGVSSPQLDEAQRGFSFLKEGPLDMRMDPTQGQSAKIWLNQASADEIAKVLKEYGEEPFAKKIAKTIVKVREEKPITTTLELANIVASCKFAKKRGHHPATQTFQAIRIFINQELAAIDQVLAAAPGVLAAHGRLVLISFHSLEDRRVKRFFRAQSTVDLPRGMALREAEIPLPPMRWILKRQRPQAQEIAYNPRARSAILRVAEKN